ncbi:class I SAM-dependent methyltransferase [Synechococcus sp. L2F]|uniref:class I SAM-dependent methyltransferase n=1 Tax=Synechococcus sp. L2F TaxID=2823739 RepID=UPI0020CEC899|nr:class I SAM-dependent methyltransferase [Synechococcus sp. L2F]MCP9828422.1 class I SAM-dependent methyltransferase [Synechococcus sp. L2F]
MNLLMERNLGLLPRYLAPSAWWEHVPIAHWLVEHLQPQTVVELGTHFGVSFFAFCEAAQAFSPQTFVYAVDTWQGDEHAGGYGEEVYQRVQSEQDRNHRCRSRLVRSSFDEAATHFPSGAIDLLHVDGLHTYDAVQHDLETWRPLLKPEAVVLFHDINVRERGFGVWRLWNELLERSDTHGLGLLHGHGLGLLSFGTSEPAWLNSLREILPLLTAKGSLLAQIAELRPECQWGERNHLPYRLQAEQHWHSLQQAREELVRLRHEQRGE